jgi:hypothetical protein
MHLLVRLFALNVKGVRGLDWCGSGSNKWRTVVNKVMNFKVVKNAVILF